MKYMYVSMPYYEIMNTYLLVFLLLTKKVAACFG